MNEASPLCGWKNLEVPPALGYSMYENLYLESIYGWLSGLLLNAPSGPLRSQGEDIN